MGRLNSTKKAKVGAILLGIGLGGFADGIFLHQILQWHHMLSSVMPPMDMPAMEINMRWDGYFHAFDWIVTVVGIFTLWNAGRHTEPLPQSSWFAGWLLFGWGIFNFVEGLVNHHLLGVHHVRYQGDVYGADPVTAWGLGFVLIGGVGFMVGGWILAHYSKKNF
ncbi:MAG: DUF2243 domain-containing protein [Balneolales bacterium]